jgi:hypothetical protein
MSGSLAAAGQDGHRPGLRVVDSITDLDLPGPDLPGLDRPGSGGGTAGTGFAGTGSAGTGARVAVAGSHGGEYSGRFALSAGLSGVIFHDAGLGLDAAGVAGLALLDRSGVAAAAVAAASARIGDGRDVHRHGVISQLNQAAWRCGVRAGMPCREAASLMLSEAPGPHRPPAAGPGRVRHRPAGPATDDQVARVLVGARHDIWVLDSASAAGPRQDGAIVVTGSHAALPGGQPRRALKCDAFLAAFNAAGSAASQAGTETGAGAGAGPATGATRLPALDQRGIAAVAVDAMSARIGSGRSTLDQGVVAVVNRRAAALGIRPGDRLATVARALADGTERSNPR